MSRLGNLLRDLLVHPIARGVDLDDPRCTELRREILLSKGFLRRVYEEWSRSVASALPQGDGTVVELGSGAGFLEKYIPGLVTSDVLKVSGISLVLDGHHLPFKSGALKAVVMIDVLHHLSRPREFFRDAARCVGTGGVIVMIEPWVTPWSSLVYTRLHHEPFDPTVEKWESPESGPLSGANGALPWILFERDLETFHCEFPEWRLEKIARGMPFSYLLSGGMSMRSPAPAWAYEPVRALERLLEPLMPRLAMFAQIELRRTNALYDGLHQSRP
ncbi:MAG: methyltransferase domain-containing protein [Desulfomonile sp.]|nr:methyltransferase domain-containing protein [Desulfomonile sp.]